ncbi:MAG: HEAT repeat domain-containing protein [Acidobacteriota bacterium]
MLVLACVMPRVSFADRISDLTAQLSSSSEKTRLSAVVSLARLGDKRALKPLVTALHDPSAQVRAIAATALGHLGHKAALPSLKNAATDDTDQIVRTKAREAEAMVAKANHLPDELATAPAAQATQARHVGFGHSPHAVTDRPDLFVQVKSSSDDSPGNASKAMRQAHADFLKQTLTDEFKAAPQVTMVQAEAQRWGLDARHLDLSVVKLEVVQNGPTVEIEAELRLAISDDTGKMLSFLSGGAKVEVPRTKFKPQFLPDLRKEAIEGAMRGMFDKLVAHLRQTSQS